MCRRTGTLALSRLVTLMSRKLWSGCSTDAAEVGVVRRALAGEHQEVHRAEVEGIVHAAVFAVNQVRYEASKQCARLLRGVAGVGNREACLVGLEIVPELVVAGQRRWSIRQPNSSLWRS